MTRTLDWTPLALTMGMIAVVSGLMAAGDAKAAPVAASPQQVADLVPPAATTRHGTMTMVHRGDVANLVHRDAATGRLALCTPTGKESFFR